MLEAMGSGMSWEVGREYMKGSVLENERRAEDRLHAVVILTAVTLGMVTEGC